MTPVGLAAPRPVVAGSQGWRGIRRAAVAPWPAVIVAGGLAVMAGVAGWRGADVPNHQFRIELFRRAGFTVWSSAWYGGHHTPGYSVLLPSLGALLGPGLVGVLAALASAAGFDRLVRRLPGVAGARADWASLIFAAGTVVNLAVGRLAFALGLAFGLAALVAGVERTSSRAWLLAAAALSSVTALASPVAGCFLALVWVAGAVVARSGRWAGLAACALTPVMAVALVFPEGGRFPFRAGALAWVVVACGVAVVLLPREWPVVRVGAALYAAAALVTFAVANPVGANITRLGMFVAAPLVVAGAKWPRAALAVVVSLLLWWQWSPAIDAVARAGRDPSTQASYYAPLLAFLADAGGPAGRVEIPFTRRHYEAAFVAPSVPLARGWERQLDMKVNSLFYEPGQLNAETYRAWLLDTGVRHVALADAALDPSARAEAALIRAGQPYLRLAWRSLHWTVWEVVGSPGLASGPAEVVGQTADTVTLQAQAAGSVLVRVRDSAFWSVDGPACIATGGTDHWVRLEVTAPGRLVLHPVLLGERARCPG